MKTQYRKQGGFVPFIAIALVALLAVGGGVFIAKKNKEHKQLVVDNTETKANGNADMRANENANLGVNTKGKVNGSLKTLLGMKKNTLCTFEAISNGVTSNGTIYLSAEGNMRGDFVLSGPTIKMADSHIIIQANTTAYAWTGTQGTKMNLSGFLNGNADTKQDYVNPNSPVSYDCKDWAVDASKFVLPSGVNFIDIDAFIKTKLPGGVIPKM